MALDTYRLTRWPREVANLTDNNLIITKGKYHTNYYRVSDGLEAIFLAIFHQRRKMDYYYFTTEPVKPSEPLEADYGGPNAAPVVKTLFQQNLKAWKHALVEYESDLEDYFMIEAANDGNAFAAAHLIMKRTDYEYEGIKIDQFERVT